MRAGGKILSILDLSTTILWRYLAAFACSDLNLGAQDGVEEHSENYGPDRGYLRDRHDFRDLKFPREVFL